MESVLGSLLNEVEKLKNFTYRHGGASVSEINSLEKLFNITLPEDYRKFLEMYGYGVWFGDGINGLTDKGSIFEEDSSVEVNTKYYHDLYDNDPKFKAVPKQGVVINRYSGGGYYFLFSKESSRSGEVGLFLTETWGKEVEKFNSFTDYLSYLVKGEPDAIAV